MARAALVRLQGGLSNLLLSPACGVRSVSAGAQQQSRNIVSKAFRDSDYVRPKPFPYEEKQYTVWRAYLDDVTHRLDENSKIIVVDGPPTGNKTQFAKQVAEELDMLHIGPAHLDREYINEYGFDIRKLNSQLPRSLRSWDIEQFLQNPAHIKGIRMQMLYLHIKFDDYIKAMAHVLNTGQGVVMNRSIYSDFVFVETMFKHGFFSKSAHKYYYHAVETGAYELLRPHMVIYLDIPVDAILKNVKARNRPAEQNSPFYKPEVLKTMEEVYKKNYLKDISKHAEVLIYDWSEGGEAEVVVEDICRIDLDNKYTEYDTQMSDWRFKHEWDWKEKRIAVSQDRFVNEQRQWIRLPRQYCEELVVSADDWIAYEEVLNKIPEFKYAPGYNPEMGDKVLFKG